MDDRACKQAKAEKVQDESVAVRKWQREDWIKNQRYRQEQTCPDVLLRSQGLTAGCACSDAGDK